VNRGAYAQYENDIFDCVNEGSASASASLSWKFNYADSSRTKPDTVQYTADFSDTQCTDMSLLFDNTL
jgi:hypothetical protein